MKLFDCPYCFMEVWEGTLICPHCFNRLEWGPVSEEVIQKLQQWVIDNDNEFYI